MSPVRADALDWLTGGALPLWHRQGWDTASGGFVERLDEAGRPDRAAPRRVRVQMRQIYVYAHAALNDWYAPARGVALDTLEFLLTRCRRPGGGPGFAHITDASGAVTDARIDAYDQAFGLLALASAYRLDNDAQIGALIASELAFIDECLIDAATGLWREDEYGSLPRRQNPQMHAFEAFLALFEVTGDQVYLRRAARIADHLRDTIIDPATGAVCEFFDAGFHRLAEGQSAEPGHHFEWVWLLHMQARLAGMPPPGFAGPLLHWGLRHGVGVDGYAIDSCTPAGAPIQASRRLWPQTEFIKAHLALEEAGDAAAGTVADAALDALMRGYFTADPRGGWVDRFDAAGRLTDGRMPVSTFYHIFAAIAEASRVSALGDS